MPDKVDLSNYVTVAERLNAFYVTKFPEGRLQASEPAVVEVGGKTFVQVRATAWRTVDDPLPAMATAWEPFPGATSFTRDSEMMNAETSALGRVLAMCGVEVRADIASSNEMRARQEEAARRAEAPDVDAPVGTAQGVYFTKFAKTQRGLTDEEIETLVLYATDGRTGVVGGVLVSEWEALRVAATEYYKHRTLPGVQDAGGDADSGGEVEDAGADVVVPEVQDPVENKVVTGSRARK